MITYAETESIKMFAVYYFQLQFYTSKIITYNLQKYKTHIKPVISFVDFYFYTET